MGQTASRPLPLSSYPAVERKLYAKYLGRKALGVREAARLLTVGKKQVWSVGKKQVRSVGKKQVWSVDGGERG